MCTAIATKLPIQGSAKGPAGWFPLTHAYITYDHPHVVPLEHALCLSFAAEGAGTTTRVAVELPAEVAREIALRILDAVARAEALDADRERARVSIP